MTGSESGEQPRVGVVSPFASAQASISTAEKRVASRRMWWVMGGIGVVLAVIAAIFIFRYVNDPYRTLEPFPVSRYLENYHSLAGSKFRGDIRVEADLGWKEGVGRLMVFSSIGDGHSFVVLMPPKLAGTYFTKGQVYSAELEVREGGLIYANSCRKN